VSTTAKIQATFEAWIRGDPGRWLWFYKRWGSEAENSDSEAAGWGPIDAADVDPNLRPDANVKSPV
jgi:hypothetical protein